MRLFAVLSIALVACFFSRPAFCQEEKMYKHCVDAVRAGDKDSAFMNMHALLSSYPGSAHALECRFSIAEYYYEAGDYLDARKEFFALVKAYPDSPMHIFSLGYLLELARKEKKDDTARALERLIVDRQRLSFLFRESKEITYSSPLSKEYTAIYYIDKVELYANGKLFTSVSY